MDDVMNVNMKEGQGRNLKVEERGKRGKIARSESQKAFEGQET